MGKWITPLIDVLKYHNEIENKLINKYGKVKCDERGRRLKYEKISINHETTTPGSN
jgi:hypothetical protein